MSTFQRSIRSNRGSDSIVIEHHLTIILVHVDVHVLAGYVDVGRHAPLFPLDKHLGLNVILGQLVVKYKTENCNPW